MNETDKSSFLNAPAIILVEPQMGENIGAAARAMANFGLSDLRLVNPRDGWPNEAATSTSSGAIEKRYVNVVVFDTLDEALADLHVTLATTARPRDMVKEVYTPKAGVEMLAGHVGGNKKAGLLFGRERNGLENAEIAKCQGIVTVPTGEVFASINLAQSVLLMAYEWGQAQANVLPQQFMTGQSASASHETRQEFVDRLIGELENSGFFRSEGLKPTMVRNITNIFSRGDLTAQEVGTLQGILSSLSSRAK